MDTESLDIRYASRRSLMTDLRAVPDGSLDLIVLASEPLRDFRPYLDECVRALRKGGLLFVQGTPERLPEVGVYLDGRLRFRFWIAVESATRTSSGGLPSVHAGVLLFARGETLNIHKMRSPHKVCRSCWKSLRDWGGKTQLMHPEGTVVSDIWKDLPRADNYSGLSQPVLDEILRLVDFPGPTIRGLVYRGGEPHRPEPIPVREPGDLLSNPIPGAMLDVVHQDDAVEVLRRYPDNSIDLAFADPPYNINKEYGVHDDDWDSRRYLTWCEQWLSEYARVLKPTGSLYVLNLPRWAMHHAAFLNRKLSFRNWIVWDARSDPRGKLIPSHYSLLFYTKRPTGFTFNYDAVRTLDERNYCLRASCVTRRKASGDDEKEDLTDIWWDIHRIRHRRDRDYHPCQLPDALLERIIRLSSNEGDIVLDALCGTGTTPVIAATLNRRYVGIDLDPGYVEISRRKLEVVENAGALVRDSISRPRRRFTKKELQMELCALADSLGRVPEPEDVERMSRYDLDAFLSVFPTWGKAVQAARLRIASETDRAR
ncbi:MAG: site-specific DNA-methyltransferase [Armatimonadetes bacterium]|nr:site-specific DNA-methyltransferase [Armatimonadota bacterium]